MLTVRLITPTLRNGESLAQVAASIMFTAGFYIPLKHIMSASLQGMSSYAQYLMPLIALQAVAFAAISAAFRSATDSVKGINHRFKAMPIAPLTPVAARMSASMHRCVIALVVSLVCGHVIGFRFYGGVAHAVGFCALVLLVGATLSLLGDVVGAAIENPEATMPLLDPANHLRAVVGRPPTGRRFPSWIRGFVRDQTVSQEVNALGVGDSTPARAAAVR